jgi:cytochrome c biogenesis protein CcmG/thiol:disulfide interchange protein DsbE
VNETVAIPTPPTRAGRIETAIKIACVALAVGGTIWALLPARVHPGSSVRSAGARTHNMPDFSLPTLDGHRWKLSDHRGDVVLVNFWATWCPPCRAEIPSFMKLSRQLAGQPFAIAGIAMDDGGAADVAPFVRNEHINYPVLLPDSSFSLGDGIDSLPTSFLVDKHGRIAKVYVGEVDPDALSEDVHSLLNEKL